MPRKGKSKHDWIGNNFIKNKDGKTKWFPPTRKKYFLTCDQTERDKYSIVNSLLKHYPQIIWCIAVQEVHPRTGGYHIHLLIEFERKVTATTQSFFDKIFGKHCNIRGVKSEINVIKYIYYGIKGGVQTKKIDPEPYCYNIDVPQFMNYHTLHGSTASAKVARYLRFNSIEKLNIIMPGYVMNNLGKLINYKMYLFNKCNVEEYLFFKRHYGDIQDSKGNTGFDYQTKKHNNKYFVEYSNPKNRNYQVLIDEAKRQKLIDLDDLKNETKQLNLVSDNMNKHLIKSKISLNFRDGPLPIPVKQLGRYPKKKLPKIPKKKMTKSIKIKKSKTGLVKKKIQKKKKPQMTQVKKNQKKYEKNKKEIMKKNKEELLTVKNFIDTSDIFSLNGPFENTNVYQTRDDIIKIRNESIKSSIPLSQLIDKTKRDLMNDEDGIDKSVISMIDYSKIPDW
jgi:hypothetical protein